MFLETKFGCSRMFISQNSFLSAFRKILLTQNFLDLQIFGLAKASLVKGSLIKVS